MKRWSATLLGMALSTSAIASHGPFTGVYGGANIGILQAQSHDDNRYQFIMELTGDSTTTPRSSDMSASAGLALGYTFRIESLFIAGLEGRVNFTDVELNHNFDFNIMGDDFSANSHRHTTIELDNDAAALVKFGMMFDADFLLYGLVGPDWGRLEFKTSHATSSDDFASLGSEKFTRYKCGLLLGLGMEYLITRCTSIAMEYNHVNYGHIRNLQDLKTDLVFDNGTITDAMVSHNSARVNTNKVSLNFNFYFG